MNALIARALAEHDCSPGATSDEISAAEERLGYPFPDELRELLRKLLALILESAGEDWSWKAAPEYGVDFVK